MVTPNRHLFSQQIPGQLPAGDDGKIRSWGGSRDQAHFTLSAPFSGRPAGRPAVPASPGHEGKELKVPESPNHEPGSTARRRQGSGEKKAAEKNERGMVAIPLSPDVEPSLGYGAVYVPLSWQVRQSSLFWSLLQSSISPVLPLLWTAWQVPHSIMLLALP